MSDKPNVYEDNTGVYYRASALGSCERALVAARLGMTPLPPPDDFLPRFADGHLHEGAVLDLIRERGIDVSDEQGEFALVVDPGVMIVGHIDAIGAGSRDVWAALGCPEGDGRALIEVKAFAQSTTEKWLSGGFAAFPRYQAQVSVYATAFNVPICFIVKNKNNGQIHASWYAHPPMDVETLKEKVRRVEAAAASGVFPACPKPFDYPCPYLYLHDDGDAVTGDEVEPVVEDQILDALAETYDRARSEEARWKIAKDEARNRIMQHVDPDGGRVQTHDWVVSVTKKSRTKTDTTRLLRDHPDLRIEYTTMTEYAEVRVSERKGNDDAAL